MMRFLLGALLINALPLLAFRRWHAQVARRPYPGLWWLGAGLAAILLTLWLARTSLS